MRVRVLVIIGIIAQLFISVSALADDSNTLDGQDAAEFAQAVHSHSGSDIFTGTIPEARIDVSITRDSEVVPTVLNGDGSGSGLDADLLDGQDAAEFASFLHNHDEIYYPKAYVDALETRILTLEAKLAAVTADAENIYVTGVNLHVRSGAGTTNAPVNGKGNLIVGYNESNNDIRTGSHNLVVGPYHTFTSYGGLVVGYENAVSGAYASVSGGSDNTASGDNSSVSGGKYNKASGDYSFVGGGGNEGDLKIGNNAFAHYSAILGGFNNMTGDGNDMGNGQFATISGGVGNIASGYSSTISGGVGNIASGYSSSISGGMGNTASGHSSSISGGSLNDATSSGSSISGGRSNSASGEYSSVSGGFKKYSLGQYNWRAGEAFQDQ